MKMPWTITALGLGYAHWFARANAAIYNDLYFDFLASLVATALIALVIGLGADGFAYIGRRRAHYAQSMGRGYDGAS